ncbi:hypothetical protein CERSUDRAFT_89231 [Gelatoporia subvermispora B]|uniref:Uncharacterized protein n=1 Tax=Ceriporiopsis subvermispora (strain B) TaxID=914234 RepID=M2QH42_CERS8|nr:hypothetical protein CERSUDRAFT_89231 [Gelatoporia subvermispora B]
MLQHECHNEECCTPKPIWACVTGSGRKSHEWIEINPHQCLLVFGRLHGCVAFFCLDHHRLGQQRKPFWLAQTNHVTERPAGRQQRCITVVVTAVDVVSQSDPLVREWNVPGDTREV